MKSKSLTQNRSKERSPAKVPPKDDFLIAAIGASAGGIEAFTKLIGHLPADTGMAFVLIQHLDPKHRSILTELIAKHTQMDVAEVSDGMVVEPNKTYVIPPNATMSIQNRTLHIGPREEARGAQMPIDHFMRSLAEDLGNRAIGVILSGTGTDGTLGMAEIQARGGVTFAESQESAKYGGMPHSAVQAGCVDYVLPPKGIARELERITRHPYAQRDHGLEKPGKVSKEATRLSTIFQLLRRSTGVDFTHYRQTTIQRRIHRRMMVHKIDRLDQYVRYLQSNPSEVRALYQEMLINVTSFFRNPDVFEAMKTEVFPNVMRNRLQDRPIRVWTPGCSTGEEAYSVAMVLLEYLSSRCEQAPLQLFGTDLNEVSIAKARTGTYPQNIEGDVSLERLRRFFAKVDGHYRVSKSIREMCIFAQHNVLHDPPFSQMDIVCCRNLLIYLEPVLQSRVISLIHYAIRPGGYLILGMSEGVGSATPLFTCEDRTHKIFVKKSAATNRPAVAFSLDRQAQRPETAGLSLSGKQQEAGWNQLETQREFDRRLLGQYTPPAVFINEDTEILHTRGNVNPYLKLAPGRASLNLLKMAREGLLMDLRNAISRCQKELVTVRKENVPMKGGNGNGGGQGEGNRLVNFEVSPVTVGNLKEHYFLIVFHDVPQEVTRRPLRSAARRRLEASSRRIAKIEQELAATKEYLQSVIETQEATNEELQSANEEILSSNEELQSTNEELETAKEELQSANEELSTVNDELRSRNLEITQVNSDLTNLFSSIDVAIVLLGSDLIIRRLTPGAEKLLGLTQGDVGRPLLAIKPAMGLPELAPLVSKVISESHSIERDVTDRNGVAYQLRVFPYQSSDGMIEGAAITLLRDIPRANSKRPSRRGKRTEDAPRS